MIDSEGKEIGDNEREDSEDLTDAEIESATPLSNVSGMVRLILKQTCPVCSWALAPHAHQLRRRKPHLYWRIPMTCGQDASHYSTAIVARIDFIPDL